MEFAFVRVNARSSRVYFLRLGAFWTLFLTASLMALGVAQPSLSERVPTSLTAEQIAKSSSETGGTTTSSLVSPHLYGILQNSTGHAAQNYSVGVRVAVIELSWASYNTASGVYSSTYVASINSRIQSFRNAGYTQFMLDLGLQYPPSWVQSIPNARFVNQYGHTYVDTSTGKNIVNSVFNAAVRTKISAYIQRVFQDLGTSWQSVRLGGLWYGELHYPPATFGSDTNCFWAFDPIAQGTSAQLPGGVTVCPVPGWLPGQAQPLESGIAVRELVSQQLEELPRLANHPGAAVV